MAIVNPWWHLLPQRQDQIHDPDRKKGRQSEGIVALFIRGRQLVLLRGSLGRTGLQTAPAAGVGKEAFYLSSAGQDGEEGPETADTRPGLPRCWLAALHSGKRVTAEGRVHLTKVTAL